MSASTSIFLPRAAKAFSSFAVTVALAVLTILALAIGSIRDSKAESNADMLLGRTRVEDPAIDWSQAGWSLPERSASDGQLQVISRRPMRSVPSVVSQRAGEVSPMQQLMGVSKLALPLLVGDLAAGRPVVVPAVMMGQAVGAK